VTKLLINNLSLSWFVKRSDNLSIDKLCGCLAELANADLLLARKVLHSYDKKKFMKEMEILDPQRRQNICGRIKKIDIKYFSQT
jgi:hypothetical protein